MSATVINVLQFILYFLDLLEEIVLLKQQTHSYFVCSFNKHSISVI